MKTILLVFCSNLKHKLKQILMKLLKHVVIYLFFNNNSLFEK